jgi:hypothetical protein
MVLKTFSLNEDIYLRFSSFCKEHGISMSKQVEFFMASQVEEDPQAREEYLKKLEQIRKGRFVKVKSFSRRYGV